MKTVSAIPLWAIDRHRRSDPCLVVLLDDRIHVEGGIRLSGISHSACADIVCPPSPRHGLSLSINDGNTLAIGMHLSSSLRFSSRRAWWGPIPNALAPKGIQGGKGKERKILTSGHSTWNAVPLLRSTRSTSLHFTPGKPKRDIICFLPVWT